MVRRQSIQPIVAIQLFVGGVLALVPAFGWAQAGAAGSSANPEQPAAKETPVFRTNANLVVVDVVVRDKGQPVHGLKAADFQIREDGKEQKISVFEEHSGTDALEAAKAPQLPPHVYSDYPQYARSSAANVLLLDALNTPLQDQVYVRRRMLAYLKTIPAGTRLAVFTLGSQLRIITGFTTDTAEIAKALGPGRGNAEKSSVMDPNFDDALDLASALELGGGGSAASLAAAQQFASDTKNFEVGLRVQMTVDSLSQMARYLSTIPGRKNLIWFSASFPLRFLQGGSSPNMDPMADYSQQVKKAAELLALARVAVYPVDSRGLLNVPSAQADTVDQAAIGASLQSVPATPSTPGNQGLGSPSMNQLSSGGGGGGSGPDLGKMDTAFMSELAWDHFNMDQIAKETGGVAFYNRNGLGEVVGEAIANGSSYYTLGYAPENRNYDGALRKIDVRVEAGHYELAYRHAYYADDPGAAQKWTEGRRSPLIDAMQHGTPPLSQVIFEVRVLPEGDPALAGEKATMERTVLVPKGMKHPKHYLVDYWIDPRAVEDKAMADGKQHREIQLTQVAYDVEGIRLNSTDAGLGVDLTRAQVARALTDGIQMHQEIDLPEGQVYLRIGVHDILSGRIGTVEIPVTVGK
jgi:VWFA-related protein